MAYTAQTWHDSPATDTPISAARLAVMEAGIAAAAALDASNNLRADAFIPGFTNVVTSGGTTTLTVDSTEIQIFTGSQVQTVVLPTTGVVAGQRYTIMMLSGGGSLGVNASGGGQVASLPAALGGAVFIALQAAPTLPAHWTYQFASVTTATTFNQGSALVQRNASGIVQAASYVPAASSTVTAAGTTTLTNNSTQVQEFTGTSTQTVVLPAAIGAGASFSIINLSTGLVTVNASGGSTVAVIPGGQMVMVMANTATPTTNANWNIVGGITASSTDTLINKTISGANNTLSVPSSALSDATAIGKTILTVPDLLTAQSLLGVADPLLSSYMTVPRQINTSTISGLVSGTLYLTSFIADKAIAINNLKSVCVGAAGATPTLSRMAIYSVDANHTDVTLQASTANNVNAFTTGGSNIVTMPLSAAFTPTVGVQYAVGLLVVTAAALPTFSGIAFNGALAPLLPWRVARVAGLSDLPSTSAGVSIDSGAKWLALWT